MNIEDLQIDLSTFRQPIVIWESNMFVTDDAIYTNYLGFKQTEEGVFFTGTVFYPSGGWLEEFSEGLNDGRKVFFSEDGAIYNEAIYIQGQFIARLNADGKINTGWICEKELFIAWLNGEGKMLKDKCFQANGFQDE